MPTLYPHPISPSLPLPVDIRARGSLARDRRAWVVVPRYEVEGRSGWDSMARVMMASKKLYYALAERDQAW